MPTTSQPAVKQLMQQPVVQDWLTQMRAENLSLHTISAYERDLTALSHFLEEEALDWIQLDQSLLHAYVNTRLERDTLSVSSVQRELSSLRQFYHTLEQQVHEKSHSLRYQNPFLGFSLKRPTRPLPHMLDVDVISQLLDQPAPESKLQAQTWLRDKAMLELLYSSGLRVAELVNVTLSDIDMAGQRVRVTGKGNKTRIVPIGKKAIHALSAWLNVRAQWLSATQSVVQATNEQPVFISKKTRKSLTTRAVQMRVTHQAKRAGIDQSVYPHLLRHCFASHMLSSSGDLRAVQELLGHANISTTQVYTHLDFEQLAHVYDGAHPRATKK